MSEICFTYLSKRRGGRWRTEGEEEEDDNEDEEGEEKNVRWMEEDWRRDDTDGKVGIHYDALFTLMHVFKFPWWRVCVWGSGCGGTSCLENFSNSNQDTDFSFSSIPIIFFFSGGEHPLDQRLTGTL